MIFVRCTLILVLLITVGTSFAEEDDGYRAFKDTDVSIRLPDGFVPSTTFLGFQNAMKGSSFVLKIMDMPLAEKVALFTPEAFASLGRKLIARTKVEVDHRTGYVYELALSRQGYDYREWYLLIDDGERTVGVTGIFPVLKLAEMSAPMKAAVLSVRMGTGKDFDPFAELPFTLEVTAPFALAKVEEGTLLFSEKGQISEQTPAAPLLGVGSGPGRVKRRDRKRVAFDQIKSSKNLRRPKLTSRIEIEVDGLPAVEIVAKAEHHPTNVPLLVYQLLIFDEDRVYFARGQAGAREHAEAIEAFRKMARSLKRKPAKEE